MSKPVRLPEGARELLTPGEVAKMFRVDSKTVSRWGRSGRLTAIMTPGGHRRYDAEEVREILSETGG